MEKKNEIQLQEEKKVGMPADLIREAIQGNANLEQLEKLLSLQERFEANEAKKAYNRAMAEFKTNPPKINKDKSVSYKEVHYHHASLANVTEKINEALSQHGLSASWSTHQNGQICVTCKITHVGGHSEQTTLSAPADASGSKNSIQAIGSAITYLQRYTLLALTGLATYDQDDDSVGAVEKISADQLSELFDMMNDVDADEEKFCKYLGINTLEDLPAKDFQKAKTALIAKRSKK